MAGLGPPQGGARMYPVTLALAGRPVLVVGGGRVALRKVRGLLAEGARVTVVAPRAVPEIERLAEEGGIVLERRGYRDGEAAAYRLVLAAADDREVNRRVFEDGERAGVFVNVADDPDLCSFHLPARVVRGPLQVAISSEGRAPFAVRRLRALLERRLGEAWGAWAEAAGRFRDAVLARGDLDATAREALFDRFFRETVDPATLAARVPGEEEMQRWIGEVGAGESARGPGLVSLVGAGPGAPDLLTARARERLAAADAIVVDRLAAPALPADLAGKVEIHDVGKDAGHHPVPQEEIEALLVRLAREGKRVVRLKGGDPFVFGRGGEEVEALEAAGIPWEVVPGVTAGIAGPAAAGIPVTHRREAVMVTLLTAHECAKDEDQVPWDVLARHRHGTLVGYMGVGTLPRVVERLLAGGMDPATPAAVIERATLPGQRVVRARLADLPRAAREAGVRPPALFVIGRVAARGAGPAGSPAGNRGAQGVDCSRDPVPGSPEHEVPDRERNAEPSPESRAGPR